MFNAQLAKWLGAKRFYPPPVKKTNFCRFRWKHVKFELRLPHSLLFIFSKKSFVGTKVSISSEKHQKFSKTQPLAMNGHARRFDRILKRA